MSRKIILLIDENKELIKDRLLSKREIKPSPDERFNDCWYWTGAKYSKQYGAMYFSKSSIIKRSSVQVHRLSGWIYLGLEIYGKIQVLHKCDNGLCFNPNHLFLGNHKDNMIDAIKKKRHNFTFTGLKHRNAVLNEEMIVKIIRKYKTGLYSQIELAKENKVSLNTIHRLINKQTYKEIK